MGGFYGHISLETLAHEIHYEASPLDRSYSIEKNRISIHADGFIYNLNQLKSETASPSESEAIYSTYTKSKTDFPSDLKGEFSTVVSTPNSIELSTNHTSSRRVFYAEFKKVIYFHWNLKLLLEELKKQDFSPTPNSVALRSLLSIGGVFGNQTAVEGIHLLRAGEKLVVSKNGIEFKRYYLPNTKTSTLSKSEFLNQLQERFLTATKRQYDHSEIPGFQLLSGGLDSRLNLSLAAQNGIQQESVLCFGQTGYRDHWISEQMAKTHGLSHEFVSLENGDYLTAIDENTLAVDGLCFYASSAHFNYALSQAKTISPIIHTGQIGRTLFTEHPHGLWQNISEYKALLCSDKFADSINSEIRKEIELYENMDVFYLNNRLYRVISSGNWVAQKVGCIISPFADPDVQDLAFSAPNDWKKNGFLQWEFMWKHHKEIMRFSQEEYGRPVRSKPEMFLGRVQNKLRNIYYKKVNKDGSKLSMNPLEYWWKENLALQRDFNSYFSENISRTEFDPEIKRMCEVLFNSNSVLEKTLALSVLSVLKNYF